MAKPRFEKCHPGQLLCETVWFWSQTHALLVLKPRILSGSAQMYVCTECETANLRTLLPTLCWKYSNLLANTGDRERQGSRVLIMKIESECFETWRGPKWLEIWTFSCESAWNVSILLGLQRPISLIVVYQDFDLDLTLRVGQMSCSCWLQLRIRVNWEDREA